VRVLAPNVFTMHGEEALLYDPDPSDEQREQVLRAAAACPVEAIVLDRMGSRDGARKSAVAADRAAATEGGADEVSCARGGSSSSGPPWPGCVLLPRCGTRVSSGCIG
jgi:ferredoxin